MKRLLDIGRWLLALLPIVVGLVPLLSEDSEFKPLPEPYAPVGFGSGLGAMSVAFSVAAVVLGYLIRPAKRRVKSLPATAWVAIAFFGASLIMMFSFIALSAHARAVSPTGEDFQIGFGKADWSLTDEGRTIKLAYPSATVDQWMLMSANFRPGGAEVLWKPWTVTTATILTMVTFMACCVLVAAAWGALVRTVADYLT